MATPKGSSDDPILRHLYRDFISACHILHYHGILDAYGHVSVRHPHSSEKFIMSSFVAPATVSSEQDLVEYWVSDAQPVEKGSSSGYAERFIHSEILKRFPETNAVVHSHSQACIPFGVSGIELRPIFHMAGFLGEGVPVWDIANHTSDRDGKDLLVRNAKLGASLAGSFGYPDGLKHTAVLMRGHGMTIMGPSLVDVVARAVYTQENANIQMSTLLMSAASVQCKAASASSNKVPSITYLSAEEARGAAEMSAWSAGRPWRLWVAEVEAHDLYVNRA